jgi:hypothetical protein
MGWMGCFGKSCRPLEPAACDPVAVYGGIAVAAGIPLLLAANRRRNCLGRKGDRDRPTPTALTEYLQSSDGSSNSTLFL